MVTREDIQATCDDIVREFSPLQIVLFGSYAYGSPSEDSDVDLLVIMPVEESEKRKKASEIQACIPKRFKMDLHVCSPEVLAYRITYNDWFLREITEKGEVLYELDGFYLIPPEKKMTELNPLTLEWIEFAEGDYSVAIENQQGDNPVFHVICFLSQQCVEKYLKALLQENNIPFRRTHDLNELLNLILSTYPSWKAWKNKLPSLTTHAVDTRYPSDLPTETDAEKAMEICNMVRDAIRTELNI
ncbi:HEPN domain-containing protein [Candidatus Poribacteria bacterium]|nr:HEPN domain-containing protein [Candidatus Poribacteria bacterium]